MKAKLMWQSDSGFVFQSYEKTDRNDSDEPVYVIRQSDYDAAVECMAKAKLPYCGKLTMSLTKEQARAALRSLGIIPKKGAKR